MDGGGDVPGVEVVLGVVELGGVGDVPEVAGDVDSGKHFDPKGHAILVK